MANAGCTDPHGATEAIMAEHVADMARHRCGSILTNCFELILVFF
jgi:hypothetical protein